jgi:hypothetical protein
MPYICILSRLRCVNLCTRPKSVAGVALVILTRVGCIGLYTWREFDSAIFDSMMGVWHIVSAWSKVESFVGLSLNLLNHAIL